MIFHFWERTKKILIIVSEENAVYLPDENLELLIGMLNACKLSLNDVALINYDRNKQMEYESLQVKFNPHIIIFFEQNLPRFLFTSVSGIPASIL